MLLSCPIRNDKGLAHQVAGSDRKKHMAPFGEFGVPEGEEEIGLEGLFPLRQH